MSAVELDPGWGARSGSMQKSMKNLKKDLVLLSRLLTRKIYSDVKNRHR